MKPPRAIQSRPATPADLVAWYGFHPPMTVRAMVWEDETGLLGIAGHHIQNGKIVVFSEMKPELPELAVWRAAKGFMAGFKLHAVCTTKDSGRFLERLGWKKQEDGAYQWLPY